MIKDKYCIYLYNCLCHVSAPSNLQEGNKDWEDSCLLMYGAMSAGKPSWKYKISGNKSCHPHFSLLCHEMMTIVVYVLQFPLCFHPYPTMHWVMDFVPCLTLCLKVIGVSNIIDLFCIAYIAVFLLLIFRFRFIYISSNPQRVQ
jgi:hypothetical protein